VLPGSLGPLDAPTARPDEPLTAGAPVGPGPGPEVLNPVATQHQNSRDLISMLAAATPSPSLTTLSAYLSSSQ
jgi:hypothetical protein